MNAQAGQSVVYLLTDIEEITEVWDRNRAAISWALTRHDALLQRAFDAHHGVVFKNVGDGFYCVFGSAAEAVAAALDGQRALHGEAWGMSSSLSVRMAVHAGPILSHELDYDGPHLSRSTRLLNMAHGGQVLIAGGLYEVLRDRLPTGSRLRDLGEYRLHELSRPEHIFQLEAAALPSEFPPLHNAVLQNTPTWPAMQKELIGREREVAALLGAILRADTGLVTLTGPGGIGKTSLAIHVATELDDHFEDGIFFVDLTQVADSNRLVAALAQSLGMPPQGGQSLARTLSDYVQGRHLLLVLDNLGEIEESTALVENLLATAPRLKVLCARREATGMAGELVFPVPGLALPEIDPLPPLARLADVGAVALFIARAQQANAAFALDAENARAVAELCVRLDGLPLALELAAARIGVHTPQQMLALLQRGEAVSQEPGRVAAQSGQALRGAIAWSYDLLDGAEQALFRRFGVFRGGANLEAIEAVCFGWGDLHSDLLTVLISLVDKNLLVQVPGAGGKPRFLMFEAIRDIALDSARACGEIDEARRRHTRFFAQIGDAVISELIELLDQPGWSGLDAEEENIRAAIQCAVESKDLESELLLVGTMGIYWSQRANFDEGRVYVDAALARSEGAPPSKALGRLLMGAGMMHWYVSDLARVGELLDRSIVVSREVGDVWGQVFSLANGGLVAQFRGDGERALRLCKEAEELSQTIADGLARSLALGDLGRVLMLQGDYAGARSAFEAGMVANQVHKSDWGRVTIANSLGDIARITGDPARAEEHYRQALAAFVEMGFIAEAASALHNLGHVRLMQDNANEALSYFTMALSEQRRVNNRAGIAECLMGIAGAWAMQGRLEPAARLAGAVEALREAIGDAMVWPAERIATEQILHTLRAALPEERLFPAMADGRVLTWEAAIAYVATEDEA